MERKDTFWIEIHLMWALTLKGTENPKEGLATGKAWFCGSIVSSRNWFLSFCLFPLPWCQRHLKLALLVVPGWLQAAPLPIVFTSNHCGYGVTCNGCHCRSHLLYPCSWSGVFFPESSDSLKLNQDICLLLIYLQDFQIGLDPTYCPFLNLCLVGIYPFSAPALPLKSEH